MDNQNDQAGAAAPKPFSYEITPRAAHVGGGWRLQLFEGAFEVGGGVYPASDDASADDMYQEALSDGDTWLTSRGEAMPPASAAPGEQPQNWGDFIRGSGYTEVAPGSFQKPVAAPASADNPSTAGAAKGGITEFERSCLLGLCERIVVAKNEPLAVSIEAAAVIQRLLAAPAAQAPAQVQWISVEDRLPPENTCLAAYQPHHRGHKLRIIRAVYIHKYAIEATGDDGESVEYNEANDKDYIKAGWYERIDNWGDFASVAVCEGTVTHWMPLPAAPEQSALGEKGGE